LKKFLQLKEQKDKGRITEADYDEEVIQWEKTMRTYMPPNYRYKALPMFFSYAEGERIKTTVVKQASQFFMVRNSLSKL